MAMRKRLSPEQLAAAAWADLSVRIERRHRHSRERVALVDRVVESCSRCGETRVWSAAGALLSYVSPYRIVLVLPVLLLAAEARALPMGGAPPNHLNTILDVLALVFGPLTLAALVLRGRR